MFAIQSAIFTDITFKFITNKENVDTIIETVLQARNYKIQQNKGRNPKPILHIT